MYLNFCVGCRRPIPEGTGAVHEGRQLCGACYAEKVAAVDYRMLRDRLDAAIARADAAEAQVAALTAAVNWFLDNAEVWGEEHDHIAALVQG